MDFSDQPPRQHRFTCGSDQEKPASLERTNRAADHENATIALHDGAAAAGLFWYSHSVYIVFNTLCTLLHLALEDLIKQVLKCCTNLDTYLAGGCFTLCMLISPPLGKNARRAKREHGGTCWFRTFCHYTVARLLKQASPEPFPCFFIVSEGFIIIRQVSRYKV